MRTLSPKGKKATAVCTWRLLDRHNRNLYRKIKKAFSLSIVTTPATSYEVYTKGTDVTISVPKGNYSSSSFTHELLHLELKSLGVSLPIKQLVFERSRLQGIFSERLCDHIINAMEHKKMFMRFLSMGYNEKDFLSDSSTKVLTMKEAEKIVRNINKSELQSPALLGQSLDCFIGKYLAAKCSCFSLWDYSAELHYLNNSHPELSHLLDDLVERWDEYDVTNSEELSQDSSREICLGFIEAFEEWYCRKYSDSKGKTHHDTQRP